MQILLDKEKQRQKETKLKNQETELKQTVTRIMKEHTTKWNTIVSKIAVNSIETRQAMLMTKMDELQKKKKKLEGILSTKKVRSSKSLDLDARIKASYKQDYFIVAEHYSQISKSLEKVEREKGEFAKFNKIQKFVKKNTELIEKRSRVFDSKVFDIVTDLVLKKDTEKEMIFKKSEVRRKKSSNKI